MRVRSPDQISASRDAARVEGKPFYFTGVPCRYGHVDERRTDNASCLTCANDRAKRAYKNDPALARRALDRATKWAQENKERAAENKRRAAAAKGKRVHPPFDQWSPARKAARRLWLVENAELVRTLKRNRKAKIRSADGCFTVEEAARIRTMQKDGCAYCSTSLKGGGHLDHITPVAKGGSNWPSNLQWLCQRCNLSKGAKDPSDFARTKGLLL